jgi:hypothetical protein
MNPSFPIPRPGVVSSPAPLLSDPSLSLSLGSPQPAALGVQNQWATLNTNLDLQRTLCKAAAAGQLSSDQLLSFSAYVKGNPSAAQMFQLELHAHQQQQLAQQKRQQQQQHSSPTPQHADQPALQMGEPSPCPP